MKQVDFCVYMLSVIVLRKRKLNWTRKLQLVLRGLLFIELWKQCVAQSDSTSTANVLASVSFLSSFTEHLSTLHCEQHSCIYSICMDTSGAIWSSTYCPRTRRQAEQITDWLVDTEVFLHSQMLSFSVQLTDVHLLADFFMSHCSTAPIMVLKDFTRHYWIWLD